MYSQFMMHGQKNIRLKRMRRIELSSVARPVLPYFSTLSLKFHKNPSSKRFMVHKVALRNRVFSEFFRCALLLSFHSCSVPIFIYRLLLPVRQTLFRKSRII